MKTETFSLFGAFKATADSYEGPDRGAEFVDALIESIPETQYEEALRQALRRLSPVYDNDYRRSTVGQGLSAVTSPDRPENNVASFTHASGRRYASKRQMIQVEEYWPAFLKVSLRTATGRKRLADFTLVDVSFHINQLEDHAAFTQADADRFKALRSIMQTKRAATVAELDPSEWMTVAPK